MGLNSSEKAGPASPNLKSQTIHVWRLTLPIPENIMEKLKSTLSADEIERARKFHFQTHCEQFIASRGGLRDILSRYLKICPQDIHFLYSRYGKPYVDNTDLTFNVSHSGNSIVYAITRKAFIGIDIEYIKLDVDLNAFAKKIFLENEYIRFLNIPDAEKPLAFYRYWTRKEAYLKAIGTGLHYSLDQVQVTFADSEKPKLLHISSQPFERHLWQLEEIILDQTCVATVATRQTYQKIYLWDWWI